MTTVSIEQAQDNLRAIIAQLGPGGEALITSDEKPVAQLIALPSERAQPRFGNCKGRLTIVAEDDEHLADFSEYMS